MPSYVLFVTAVLFAAGCGPAKPSPSASPDIPVAGADCPAMRAAGQPVTFGSELRGIVFGSGHAGVVLAHQSGADVCSYAAIGTDFLDRYAPAA